MKLFTNTDEKQKHRIPPTIRLVEKTGERTFSALSNEKGLRITEHGREGGAFLAETVRSDQESRLNLELLEEAVRCHSLPPDSRNPRITSGNSTDTKSVSSATLCPFYRILGQPDLGMDLPRDYGCNLATEIGD